MEFLIVFVPGALLVEVVFVLRYLRDRRLVRLLRARHPEILSTLRGRERRWYDASEEMWVQQPDVRRALLALLAPRLPGDPALAAAIGQVERGEQWFRRALWLALGFTLLLILSLWVRYRVTGGS